MDKEGTQRFKSQTEKKLGSLLIPVALAPSQTFSLDSAPPLRTMDDDGESTAEYLHKEQMYMDRLEKQVRMVKAQIPSRGPLKNGRKTVEELFEAVKARDENHEALDKAGLIWYGKESPDPNNDKRRVMYGTELPDNGRVYRNTLRPD